MQELPRHNTEYAITSQSYKLSTIIVMKKKTIYLLLGLTVAVLGTRCTHPRHEMAEADRTSMQGLRLFFEQEQYWMEALKSIDKPKAEEAMDSMSKIISTTLSSFNRFPISQNDSLYFEKTVSLFRYLESLNDTLYPTITRKAFLPEREYTYREDEYIAQLSSRTDSTLGYKLKAVRQARKQMLNRFDLLPSAADDDIIETQYDF